jgi:outer membrane immunogenic protein
MLRSKWTFSALVATSAMLSIGAASAADMAPAPYTKAPPPPVYVSSLTGCYIEGGGGYGLWNMDHYTDFATTPVGQSVNTTDGGRGWLGRVGAGCDYQIAPKWLIGGFGEYDFMSLKGTMSPSELFAFGIRGTGLEPLTSYAKESSAWYVGARVGYELAPGILTYVNAGYTETHFNSMAEFGTFSGTPDNFGFPGATYHGWFVGGGTDTSLADWFPSLPHGLFLRSEYRYSEYDQRALGEYNLTSGVPTGNVLYATPYVQTVTTSLVWKFNWAQPVVAKY